MSNPLLAMKALKLGVKVIKKVVKKNKIAKKAKGGPEHNLGHMIPKNKMNHGRRKLAGSERYKYAEKAPDFKKQGQLPLIKGKKAGTKTKAFKIEKSASGYQKPILKGGQLKSNRKGAPLTGSQARKNAARKAWIKEGRAKNKAILKKVGQSK